MQSGLRDFWITLYYIIYRGFTANSYIMSLSFIQAP
jgi:hypothetical protein